MSERGQFITLEGCDGAGKSTQARTLAQRLRARGRPVVSTREPGGSPWAERLREALIGRKGRTLDPAGQAVIFAAGRADHLDTLIVPALSQGYFVVCDRFMDSTEAYQGADGADPALLNVLRTLTVGAQRPDLTFILDCPPEIAIARLAERESTDAFEAVDAATLHARRDAFLAIAARDSARCVVVDASLSPDALADRIWEAVKARLLDRPSAA
ncbi:MAG: dTMP kinase [Pseudomonadota bacterium]